MSNTPAENGEAASRQDAQAEEDAVPGSIAQGTNSDAETAAPGALAPPTNTPATGPQADAAGDTAEASPEAAPRDAREELEKILLGSSGLLQQANQQGLVDPQNPYGKSGYLDITISVPVPVIQIQMIFRGSLPLHLLPPFVAHSDQIPIFSREFSPVCRTVAPSGNNPRYH